MALAVRQQQIFMPGMKFYQRAGGLRSRQGFLPTMIGENPIDKILAQRGIIQAAFFFHGHQRKSGHDRGGEQAATAAHRQVLRAIDAHPLDAAARRVLFEHITGEL